MTETCYSLAALIDRAQRAGLSIARLARLADVDGRRLYNAARLRPEECDRIRRVVDDLPKKGEEHHA